VLGEDPAHGRSVVAPYEHGYSIPNVCVLVAKGPPLHVSRRSRPWMFRLPAPPPLLPEVYWPSRPQKARVLANMHHGRGVFNRHPLTLSNCPSLGLTLIVCKSGIDCIVCRSGIDCIVCRSGIDCIVCKSGIDCIVCRSTLRSVRALCDSGIDREISEHDNVVAERKWAPWQPR
jgi:hypothetical protein